MIQGIDIDWDNFIARRSGDKLQLPSVTSCIKKAGFISDMSYVNEHALTVGKAVHLGIKYLEAGTLDWDSVEPYPEIAGRIRAWQKFKQDTQCETIFSEQPVWNPIACYWGILDWAGMLDGLALIDYKSGIVQDWVRYQTAGYAECLQIPNEIKIPKGHIKRFGLQLKPDGNYVLSKEFNDRHDTQMFLSMVAHMWEKLNKGYLKHREANDAHGVNDNGTGSSSMAEGGEPDNRTGKDNRPIYQGFEQP